MRQNINPTTVFPSFVEEAIDSIQPENSFILTKETLVWRSQYLDEFHNPSCLRVGEYFKNQYIY